MIHNQCRRLWNYNCAVDDNYELYTSSSIYRETIKGTDTHV